MISGAVFPSRHGPNVALALFVVFAVLGRAITMEGSRRHEEDLAEAEEAAVAAAEAAAAAAEDEAIMGDIRAVSDEEAANKMADFIDQIEVRQRNKALEPKWTLFFRSPAAPPA